MASLQKIDHIVVLMLENRSFDSLLGTLYPKSDSFEGLNGTEQNPDANGTPVAVWNSPGTDETTMRIPNPDPGELWTDINMQLFGNSAPPPGQRPTMVGFVQNYLAQRQLNPQQTYDPKSVMHYFAPAQLPVLSQLAQKFAVCDHWFASAPCQTWPNRWFVHAATADGHENNEPPHFPNVPTIFNRLEQAGINSWKIYFHDIAQAHTLLQLFLLGSHFHSYRQFQADCQTGQLPAYSFIEPQYFADFGHPENDQHPPSVVTLGEQLIATSTTVCGPARFGAKPCCLSPMTNMAAATITWRRRPRCRPDRLCPDKPSASTAMVCECRRSSCRPMWRPAPRFR